MIRRREHIASLSLLIAVVITGCSGNQAPEVPPTYEPPVASTQEPSAKPDAHAPTQEEGLTPAQKEQLEIALRRGGEKAAHCADVVPEAPRGEGEVKVTFDGKKGRATDVSVGPPFAGTPVESCIKRAFVGEIVVPFDGELEVPYTVKLPPKPGDASKDPKAKDPKKK